MTPLFRLVVAFALVLTPWRAAWAYRPFDGTDAGVAEPHVVELELGPVGYEREGSTRALVAPALVLNYGFAPGLEAVLEGRQRWGLRHSGRRELDDVALSLKSVLRRGSLQGLHGLSVAIETGALLPGSERRAGAHVASIFSWQSPALTLHLNLDNDISASVEYTAESSLILEGPADFRVRPVAELLLAREFGAVRLTRGLTRSALIGAIVRWNEAWVFDFALRYGVRDGIRQDEARLGFTWAFELGGTRAR